MPENRCQRSQKVPSAPGREDFSLILGGPLYQLWLPLAVLRALAATLVGGLSVPLLFDLDTRAKSFIYVPRTIGAEVVVHFRMGPSCSNSFRAARSPLKTASSSKN